jgi:dihydropyrimidinase
VEEEGTHRFATFLETTGASGYIVHLSCERALRVAARAKDRGTKLSIECVIPHLLLDKTYAERPGVEGMKYVMSPPLRSKGNQKALWNAVETGLIDTVATDHCPFDTDQKLLGRDAFTQIPNGIPCIEDRVNLLYTYGVRRGNLGLHRFVDAASTRAAKLFGLFPRKGTIAVGSDADLVVYDPDDKTLISARTHHVNNDYSGFEGMEIDGHPVVVTVRVKIQMKDGKFVGDRRRGQMLRREPNHF